MLPKMQHRLLKKLGYSGPADADLMNSFMQSNPSVAAKIGKFETALRRGFNVGGLVSTDLDTAKQNLTTAESQLLDVQRQLEENPDDVGLQEQNEALAKSLKQAQQDLVLYRGQQEREAPSATEVLTSAVEDPTSLTTKATAAQIGSPTPDQIISGATGQAGKVQTEGSTSVSSIAEAASPEAKEPATVAPIRASEKVSQEADNLQPVQGQVSEEATVQAPQGQLSPEALAEGAKMDPAFVQTIAASGLEVTPEQLVTAKGQDKVAPASRIAQSTGIDPAVAAQGTVSANEIPEAAQIKESEMAQAEAVVSGGQLAQDSLAVAAKLGTFSVDNETLAEAVQGDVNAQDTVQGQLSQLMQQFNDGTPAWAAGAVRAANAAMSARGLSGSSMAGAAILQAAMESAIPIAVQDAQTFSRMNLSNLDRRQQTALSNAAAQQGLALQNLSNEQQAALQNSANSFRLQSQDLSNLQQVVLANAQIKASLQEQNLSNRQQVNLVTAARYAENAKMNLNNRQQTALQNNANNLNVELANLNNRQQAYVVNAQLEASLQGKVLDNEQQAAIQNAARFAETANIEFSAEERAKLHNSELMKTIGLTELNAEQGATLQNAAQVAAMDTQNLNNRQQAAVQNAQNFLQMDLTNLNNEQQTAIFKSQQRINSILTDQAAENAALQFNAASENQVNQFFAELSTNVSRFNADQTNAVKQFNAGQENADRIFNAQIEAAREQFNAQNSLVIAQANAKWRQDISTLDTAAQNEANLENARTANIMTKAAMDELFMKERDLLAFSFQSGESTLDRQLELLLADKREDLVRWQEEKAEDAAKGQLITMIGADLLFGGGGGGGGLLGGLF